MTRTVSCREHFIRGLVAALIAAALTAAAPGRLSAQFDARADAPVVISEIYGGGGNAGAFYTHDFVELFNAGPDSALLSGWSVQYQASGGTAPFGSIVRIDAQVPPFGYLLIQLNPGSGGTEPLPAPDATGTFALASSNGKVALVRDTLPVSGPADSTVVDFAGYGTANEFEGPAAAPPPGNTTSIERKAHGTSTSGSMAAGGGDEFGGNGHDMNDNAGDFVVRDLPGPQNSASAPEPPAGGADTTMGLSVGERWNLLSLPVNPDDPLPAVLFPAALTQPTGFATGEAGGYVALDTLRSGAGFWLKFPAADTIELSGSPVLSDTLLLADGWNLIGTVLQPVPVGSIVESPAGHVASYYFSFDDGYLPALVLEPGRGYWVKSAGGGTIVLGSP